MARLLAVICVGVAVVVAAQSAAAQALPRVAIGPFTGPRADSAQRSIASVLREHSGELAIVPDAEYGAAADRLGVRGMAGDEDMARVGRELRLDAIVSGEVTRRGRQFHLRLRVVRGRDGSQLGVASWELPTLEELEVLSAEIWSQIRGYLRVDEGRVSRDWGSETPGGGSSNTGSSSTSATPPSSPTPGLGFLSLSIGGGASQRFWRMSVLGETSPRGYDNPGYGELRAEAMVLYRFANDRAGIGASVGGALPVGLTSRATNASTGAVETLPTSALEVWGGLAAVLRPNYGGYFRIQVGFATQGFSIDTDALPFEQRLSPVSYTGLRGAFDCVMPVYATPRWEVGALLGGELRVTEVGAEMKMRFGESPRPTLAFGLTLGLSVRLDGVLPGLGFRLATDLIRYRTTFNGRYSIGPGGDSIDDYFRFYLSLSYAFGTSAPRP